MNQFNRAVIFCYGEVLWDVFPDGKRAGGAPFNVAYNLKKMGIEAHMISRVGNDTLGQKLLNKIAGWNIPVEDCQTDSLYATGTVIANIDKNNEAHYDIVNSVAWDFIEYRAEDYEKIKNADAFIFGSLIARNPKSYQTLLQLLEVAKYKVFDINIREPYFTIEIAQELLKKADLVKMNKSELKIILSLLGEEYKTEDDSVQYIQNRFNIPEVIITKGSKGALYFKNNDRYEFPALNITIKDTVGSGDAFLAGFISRKFSGGSPIESMEQAISLGAFITSKSGACPDYTIEDFKTFCKAKSVTSKLL